LTLARVGHLPRRRTVDEQVEQLSAEQPRAEPNEADEEPRFLTQRELVRASLLRCPPPEPPEQADH